MFGSKMYIDAIKKPHSTLPHEKTIGMCTALGLTEKRIRLIGCGFVSRIFGLQKYDIFNISQPIDVDFSRSLLKTKTLCPFYSKVDQHNRAPEQSGAFVLFEGKN